ncbi:hypothetical protein O181_060259, partial [Austropuccinia psidii MF-1]|nr:hypothetical protein [Austropuccinia psidii MF-1]
NLGISRNQPEDREGLEEDTLDTVVDGKTLREIIPTLQFTFQFNRDLKPEDWKDIDEVLQLHQLLRDLFQWSMDNQRFNLAYHWEEIGASCQKIFLKEIPFKDLMVITKGWNPIRQISLLEERATNIRENQATIQAIEEQLSQTGPTLILSGAQGVDQPNSPVASNHSGTRKSVAKSHHYSQSQVASRRRQGYKGKNKTSFGQRQKESDPMIQKLLGLVKEDEHSVVTPDSNLNSDARWLQIPQNAEKTQNQFAELQEIHERMEKLTASMDKIIKTLQKGHAQLTKASEETIKILNKVYEEHHHCKRGRDCLDQELNKWFNVYHNMKPQPQGHVLDNPYHQEDIKPDASL